MLESSEITPADENESSSTVDQRLKIWNRIRPQLSQHSIPDSRFHHDIAAFVPDFHKSSIAINRVLELDCYKSASSVFVAPENSLEQLRYRVLKDGKKVLIATRELRRGFILLDPRRISEDRYELAGCLDGMEKPGIGRYITLAQLQDEGIAVDMFIVGSWAVSRQGQHIWKNSESARLQWLILADRGILGKKTPVITVVHGCQVVDEKEAEAVGKQHRCDDIQCDYVITPGEVIKITEPRRLDTDGPWLDNLDDGLVHSTPPLQELKGIKTMERIMNGAGVPKDKKREDSKIPNSEEQMGMDIVARLMRGYKV